jgi:hypothetical protein
MDNRIGQPFFIYALVCPVTLEVKYVGQTIDLENRGRSHTSGSTAYNSAVQQWLRTLGYLRPYRVILERGTNRRVEVKATTPDGQRGRRPIGLRSVWLSHITEAKWLKRFRRTILNKDRVGILGVEQLLTNPPLPWEVEGS